jgi:GNAT superfamily N-acetyltransferase
MRIEDIDPQSDTALSMLREAAADVRPLYGEIPGPPWPKNTPLSARDAYVAAFVDDEAVACGALREIDSVTCEVQRMYTSRSHRRRGAARAILSHLHMEARRLGYKRLKVETGNRQMPAMKLYESYGFARIEPFGKYAQDPTSVCYELPVDESRLVPIA